MEGESMLHKIPSVVEALKLVRQIGHSAFVSRKCPLMNGAAWDVLTEQYDRDPQIRFGVAFVDLAGFKEVNDKHGHDAGDVALRQVGVAIAQCAQAKGADAFHLGGDEYAIVSRESELAELANAMAANLSSVSFNYNGQAVSVGMNVGFCLPAEPGQLLGDLRSRADAACRVAKGRAKGAAVEWSRELVEETPDSYRKKCMSCHATTTVMVRASVRRPDSPVECANCGIAFPSRTLV